MTAVAALEGAGVDLEGTRVRDETRVPETLRRPGRRQGRGPRARNGRGPWPLREARPWSHSHTRNMVRSGDLNSYFSSISLGPYWVSRFCASTWLRPSGE